MQTACAALMTALLLCACACASAPPTAAAAAAAAAAIDDSEPDVTEQVAAILTRTAQGALGAEPLTENARSALPGARMDQLSTALRACGDLGKLALLERKTKGEERQYLYRAPCGGKPLRVEIYFGKGARISHLDVRPE
jgi:hypothetical protein